MSSFRNESSRTPAEPTATPPGVGAPDGEASRPAPRLLTLRPLAAVLAAVVLLVVGGAGGMLLQDQLGADANPVAAGPGGQRFPDGGPGQGAERGQNGEAVGGVTAGEVTSVKGSTLYVETNDGTTVRVVPGSGAEVTRNAKANASAVQPGDTVVVSGEADDDGTISADAVSATAAGVAPSRGGGMSRGNAMPGGARGQ